MENNPANWWRGRVVEYTPPEYTQSLFGHIVGLARNALNEPIVVVEIEDGKTRKVHPSKIKLH